jgi:Tfp pilus assembly protein FimT
MSGQARTALQARTPLRWQADERGVSILETLVALAMVMVLSVFALMRIVESQQSLRLDNEIRQFKAYLEKARLDSIRRHAQTDAQMAKVTINSLTSYTVLMDANGDGTLDQPRTINLQPQGGITFTGATPTIIRYNWRGRTVDAAGNLVSIASFNLKDTTHAGSTINLSGSGMALDANVNMSTVSASTVPSNANIQTQVKLP